ncbi:MAG: transglycosylase domain-containing protein [bacterium]|nr:transglycosylase domain-containing protein [bacterium]
MEKKKQKTVNKAKTIKKKNSKNIKNNKPKKDIKNIVITVLLVGLIALIALSGIFMGYIVLNAPEFDPDALDRAESTIVYDKDGNELVKLGAERREKVTYDELPQVLIDALIATEDSRFFQHNGFDAARFLKASIGQLAGNSSSGGASTITMQVVKNNFTSSTSTGIQGIIRKFTDIYMSVFKLERNYTKEEIIEFYVNNSVLGSNNYGVEQASQSYFGKSVSELSLPEAALIVGLYQAPNKYNPYLNAEAATERRKTVLYLMKRHGYITEEEENIANSIPVTSLLAGSSSTANQYQGFIDTVVDEIVDKTGNDPYLVPMKIYTTMDKSVQDGINNILNGQTYSFVNDVVQAGIAITDVESGAILALGAGRNREGERVFNFATMSKRQPGSTAKPIFDYGPGMEYNNYSTYTLFVDEPWTYSNGKTVNNWDRAYYGTLTLRNALAKSRNIPALKAFQQTNNEKIIEFVTSLGIEPEIESNRIHEAHAIGGFTGVSPLQMSAAYAAFANGGYYTAPYSVTKIEYRSTGEVEEFKPKKQRVMSDSTAYMITDVLKYAVDYGFPGGAKVSGMEVAAKTGTSNFDDQTMSKYNLPSNAVNDLWTVAYTPTTSIALWYGYDTISSDYYNGSGSDSQKNNLMAAIMKIVPRTNKTFTKPDSVVECKVEMGTNPAQLASESTPSDAVVTELFKKGTEPTEISTRYDKLSNVTGLTATYTASKKTVNLSWNYTAPSSITDSIIAERGKLGFGVYLQDSSGNQKLLVYTNSMSYTYTVPSSTTGSLTFVVKVEHENYKDNASSGVSKTVSVGGSLTEDDDDNSITTAKITLNGDTAVNLNIGDIYTEEGYKVMYNGSNVTTNSTVSITVKSNGKSQSVSSLSSVSSLIDTSSENDYTIEYTIKYKSTTKRLTRTVIVN